MSKKMQFNLKESFEQSLANSGYKSQTEFTTKNKIDARSVHTIKTNVRQCRLGAVEKVANAFDVSILEFIFSGCDLNDPANVYGILDLIHTVAMRNMNDENKAKTFPILEEAIRQLEDFCS